MQNGARTAGDLSPGSSQAGSGEWGGAPGPDMHGGSPVPVPDPSSCPTLWPMCPRLRLEQALWRSKGHTLSPPCPEQMGTTGRTRGAVHRSAHTRVKRTEQEKGPWNLDGWAGTQSRRKIPAAGWSPVPVYTSSKRLGHICLQK